MRSRRPATACSCRGAPVGASRGPPVSWRIDSTHLLDAARIEAGRKEYQIEPIDTSAWLRSVVDEARPHAARRHTNIAATIPDALPNLRQKVEADPAHPTLIVGVRGVGYRFDG